MTAIYDIQRDLREFWEGEPNINRISFGFFDRMAMDKTTMFPMVHFNFPEVTPQGSTANVRLEVQFLDKLDESKEWKEGFAQGDDYHDVLNAQYYNVARLLEYVRRGTLGDYQIETQGATTQVYDTTAIPLTGWRVEFLITIPTVVDACTYESE